MMGIFCNLIRDLDYTDVCVHLNSPNITVEKWVSVITHVNVTPKRKKKKSTEQMMPVLKYGGEER